MPARPILLYPDHRLKTKCDSSTDLAQACVVAQDLLDTMEVCPPRTVGIAAPQIGAMVRLCIVHSARNPKHPGGNGLLVLVNPVIVEHCGQQIMREGCLSLPDYTANVARSELVVVEATDLAGDRVHVESEGFEAVVLQHEIDHLDGLLFLDRVANLKTDLFRRKS